MRRGRSRSRRGKPGTHPSSFAASIPQNGRARVLSDSLSGGCCGFALTSERRAETTAGVDLELAVRAAEMLLDRLRGDEERLGDLLVAKPVCRHLCDAPPARGQLGDATHLDATWTRTGGCQFLVASRSKCGATTLMGELESVA